MNQSFNMKPATTPVPPCEKMSKEQQAVVDRYRGQQAAIDRYRESVAKSRGRSAEQRKALEYCPLAQRDDVH